MPSREVPWQDRSLSIATVLYSRREPAQAHSPTQDVGVSRERHHLLGQPLLPLPVPATAAVARLNGIMTRIFRSPWRAVCVIPADGRALAERQRRPPRPHLVGSLLHSVAKNWTVSCCATVLHTLGAVAYARETCPTHPVGNTSTNAQLGCRSLRHTVSGAASTRLLCCFVLQTIRVYACCKQCCTGESNTVF